MDIMSALFHVSSVTYETFIGIQYTNDAASLRGTEK